jgi:hypothetical protein
VTVSGTTGQFGGTLSAQNGEFSNSLTVSGVPVEMSKFSKKNFDKVIFTSLSGTQTIFSETIPANSLGIDKTAELYWIGKAVIINSTTTVKMAIKFGDTLFWGETLTLQNTTQGQQGHAIFAHFRLSNRGSISSQIFGGYLGVSDNQPTASGAAGGAGAAGFSSSLATTAAMAFAMVGSGTVDTTQAQVFSIDVHGWSAAAAGRFIERSYYSLEIV